MCTRSCTASSISYTAQTAQAHNLQKVVGTAFRSVAQFGGSGPRCALVNHNEHFEQYKRNTLLRTKDVVDKETSLIGHMKWNWCYWF